SDVNVRKRDRDIIERCAGGKEKHHIRFQYSGAYRSYSAQWWLATGSPVSLANLHHHEAIRASPVMASSALIPCTEGFFYCGDSHGGNKPGRGGLDRNPKYSLKSATLRPCIPHWCAL